MGSRMCIFANKYIHIFTYFFQVDKIFIVLYLLTCVGVVGVVVVVVSSMLVLSMLV